MASTMLEQPQSVTQTAPVRVYKFRLLAGTHSEQRENGRSANGPILQDIHWGPVNPRTGLNHMGSPVIIETNIDLHLLYDQPGAPVKFEPLYEHAPYGLGVTPSGPSQVHDVAQSPGQQPSTPKGVDYRATLEAMSVKQLQQYATAEEIDTKGSSKKDELISLIMANN